MSANPVSDCSKDEIKDALKDLRHDFRIAIDSHNPYNIGGVIRGNHCFLGKEVIVIGKETWYKKGDMGTKCYEQVTVLNDENEFIDYADKNGFVVYGFERELKNTVNIFSIKKYPPNVCLLFGNESNGISGKLLSICQKIVCIPMWGVQNNLNVCVAASIAMYDFVSKNIISK